MNSRGVALKTRAVEPLPDLGRARDFSASDAKARLGEVIDIVAAGGIATITRRGRQRYALLRLETVESLVAMARDHALEVLSRRYDELTAQMQKPKAKLAVDALFNAGTKELGRAARRAAKRRG